MRLRNSCSLIGIFSTICTYLGVPVEQAKDTGSCSNAARLFGGLAMIIDALDLVLDVIFIVELHREGHAGWAALMACASILAHLLDFMYEPIVKTALDRNGLGLTFAYYFGTSECIIFLLEDSTTIFLFSSVPGAFDVGSVTDVLNLATTLLSALVVTAFVSVGGAALVCRGRSALWIPNLAITKVAGALSDGMGIGIGRVMSTFILLKCCFVAASIGFYTYVTVAVVLKGELVSGGLSSCSTAMYVFSILLGLTLSLRSEVRIREGPDASDESNDGRGTEDYDHIQVLSPKKVREIL